MRSIAGWAASFPSKWRGRSIPEAPETRRAMRCMAGRAYDGWEPAAAQGRPLRSQRSHRAQTLRQSGEEGAEVVGVGERDLDAALAGPRHPALALHGEGDGQGLAGEAELVGHGEEPAHGRLVEAAHGGH